MALAQYQRPTDAPLIGPNGLPVYQDTAFTKRTNKRLADSYSMFADEAKNLGITDPNAIDQYAYQRNFDPGIHGDENWFDRNMWAGPAALAGIGYAAPALLGGSAAEGASSALPGVQAGDEAFAGVGGGGAGTSVGSGALEGGGTTLASGPGTQVAGGTGMASSGSALSRILDGSATTADWLSVGGNLGSSLLGVAGSRNAANTYGNLAGQYMAFGAPSRARYEASMTPGFDPSTIPGYSGAVDTASRGLLARLAATGGNPYGNPGGLIEANKQIISGTALPAIEAYQRLNAGTGGYAGFNAAAPGASTAQIGAQSGVYNAVGSGLAGLLNPQPSIIDTLRGLGVSGLS